MEAYFNELSLHSFTDNETAKKAFLLLGNCLKKLSEMSVSNTRMTDEATRKGILNGQTLNRVLNNEAVIEWHSRFTPGAGRIHFYYDESEKIFYIGYIGEKL